MKSPRIATTGTAQAPAPAVHAGPAPVAVLPRMVDDDENDPFADSTDIDPGDTPAPETDIDPGDTPAPEIVAAARASSPDGRDDESKGDPEGDPETAPTTKLPVMTRPGALTPASKPQVQVPISVPAIIAPVKQPAAAKAAPPAGAPSKPASAAPSGPLSVPSSGPVTTKAPVMVAPRAVPKAPAPASASGPVRARPAHAPRPATPAPRSSQPPAMVSGEIGPPAVSRTIEPSVVSGEIEPPVATGIIQVSESPSVQVSEPTEASPAPAPARPATPVPVAPLAAPASGPVAAPSSDPALPAMALDAAASEPSFEASPEAADDLAPSPEYLAAREAALQSARARKRTDESSPRAASDPALSAAAAPVSSLLASGSGPHHAPKRRPSASPSANPDHDLQRSYEDVLAAIDGEEESPSSLPRAASLPPPPMPNEDLAALYGDDDDEPPPPPEPVDPSQWNPLPEPGHQHHTARKPSGPAPGFTNATIPLERNPARMAIGILIMAIGGFLLAWYLPGHAPLQDPAAQAAGVAASAAWRFAPDLYLKARIASSGFLGVGLLFILHGIFFRPHAEIVCKRCKRYVIAERDGVNLKCPRSSHVAGLCYKTIVLMILFLACVGTSLLFIALGNVVQAGS